MKLNIIPSYNFSRELGWSASRYKTFKTCPLKYYWMYYAKYDTENDTKHIERLKKLSSSHLAIGTTVHFVIEQILRRHLKGVNKPINEDKLRTYISQAVDNYIKENEFTETYYGTKEINTQEIKQTVNNYIFSFLKSNKYKWILSVWEADPEKTIIETPNYGEVRLDGIKAYLKADFMFVDKNDVLYIIDWKTGKRNTEEHLKQVKAYSIWVKSLPEQPKRKEVHVFYLNGNYEELKKELTEDDVSETLNQIKSEINEMQELLDDKDNNIPKAKSEFMLKSAKNNLCPWCNFREICPLFNHFML